MASDNEYAVDYRPRLIGWQPRFGLDDLVEASGRKCYGPFDHGREHNYNAAIE